MTTIQYDTIR